MLIAKNINSIHNNNTKKFFLFQTIPTKPILNKINEKFNNTIIGISITFNNKKIKKFIKLVSVNNIIKIN
jgi:hypothetical protein